MHAKEAEMHQLQAKTQVQTFDSIFELKRDLSHFVFSTVVGLFVENFRLQKMIGHVLVFVGEDRSRN